MRRKFYTSRPVVIKNSNVQTVRRDLRNRNDPELQSNPYRDETHHSEGIVDGESIVDDSSEGGGVLDDNDVAVTDDMGYADEDIEHEKRLYHHSDEQEKKQHDAQYYVEHS